jgi:hypothetical protein
MNQPLQGKAQEQRKKHPFHNLLTQQLTEELVNAPAAISNSRGASH